MVVVLAWLLVAVIGSGPDPDRSTWLGTSSLDTVLLVALLVASAIGAVLLIILRPIGQGDGPPPRRRRSYGVYVMAAIALLLLVWRPDLLELFREGAESVEREMAGDVPELAVDPDDEVTEREPVAELGDLIGLAALAAVAAAALWLLNRSPGDDQLDLVTSEATVEAPTEADELARAVDTAQAQVVSTSDPRSAVIAAYLTLERVLAANGRPRARSETPEEHLVRATSQLGVDPSAFAELGRLYALARFSDHPISEPHRDDATAALGRATEALGAMR